MASCNTQGVCVICGKGANLRCSKCRLQYYCNKDHQRKDWQNHKSSCRVWEVCETPELGKHLLATKDLNSSNFVISERPLCWGPSLHCNESVCVGCGNQRAFAKCPKCSWPSCSPDCQGLLDDDRHGVECILLVRARILPRYDILFPLRLLLLQRRNAKRWALLNVFESHEESRGPGTESYEEMQNIVQYLNPILESHHVSKDLLRRICGIIDVNALETNPPEGSIALYEITCLMEHHCIANTRHSFSIDSKGRPCVTVSTVTSVKKGEHLTTMYTHALWATRARREHLFATKYFLCRCERCADATELGTHLSTLRCSCGLGLVLPIDPLDSMTEWSCDSCSGVLTSPEVMQLTERLGEEVENALKIASQDVLADLLSRLEVLLHPNHQHCIAVGHSLIQLLTPNDPRKLEISKRIIQITDILDPYGARLSLYTAVALRELAACPGEDRRALLTRAMSLLKFEPPDSPGAKLSKLLNIELS